MQKFCFVLFCALLVAGNASVVSAQQKSAANEIKKIAPAASQPATLKTAQTLSFEAQILAEINLARQKPLEYAAFLEEYRRNFHGKELRMPDREAIMTNEGVAAVDEAIAFLKAAKPLLGTVGESRGLLLAARDHFADLQKTGGRGHRGSDGSLPDKRIERYGAWDGGVSEIIKYGAVTAREIVIGAILDDGNPGREHRKDLFDGKFKIAGIAAGAVEKHGNLCVIVMTVNLTEKNSGQNTPAVKRF